MYKKQLLECLLLLVAARVESQLLENWHTNTNEN